MNAISRSCALAWALVLLGATIGRGASADPVNYQKYIIGERALGLGGAYTAAVNDPMAMYYNPGAMVFAGTSMISASQNLYSLDYRKMEGGFIPHSGDALDAATDAADARTLEHRRDLKLPSTLAVMAPIGPRLGDPEIGPERQAVGVSLLVPYQDSYTLRAKWNGSGSSRDEETYSLTESYDVVWIGVSYGLRLAERWGIGLSGFLSTYSYSRRYDQSRLEDEGGPAECGLYRCGYIQFDESLIKLSVVSLIFRLGVLFAINDSWRLGLAATAPGIPIEDLWLVETKGSLDQTRGVSRVQATADDFIDFYTDDYKLKVKGREPASFRLGGAYLQDSFTLGLDVSLHLPVSYKRIEGDPVARRFAEDPLASPEWFDPGVVRDVVRKMVVNTNLGTEVILADRWTVRVGLFTDLSGAPDLEHSDAPMLTQVHRFGGTFSVGYRSDGYDLTLGATGSIGAGEAARYNPVNPRLDGNGSELPWEPVDYQERAIYVFIAGAQKAVAKTARKLLKRAAERRDEDEEDEVPEDRESQAEGGPQPTDEEGEP